MKKLTTGKIWQFAAGQLDGRCCPGLFLTGLYIFISRIRQPSVRDRQYLFHRAGGLRHIYYYWRNYSFRKNF